MIRQTDPLKFWWDVGVLVLSVIVCYLLPIEIAFKAPFGDTLAWKIFDFSTEAVFTFGLIF